LAAGCCGASAETDTPGERLMPPKTGLTGGMSCSLKRRSKETPTLDAALSSSTCPKHPLSTPKLTAKHQLAR